MPEVPISADTARLGAQAWGSVPIPRVFSTAGQVLQVLVRLDFVELFYWGQDEGLRGPGVVAGEGCDLELWSAGVPDGFHQLTIGGEHGAMP